MNIIASILKVGGKVQVLFNFILKVLIKMNNQSYEYYIPRKIKRIKKKSTQISGKICDGIVFNSIKDLFVKISNFIRVNMNFSVKEESKLYAKIGKTLNQL